MHIETLKESLDRGDITIKAIAGEGEAQCNDMVRQTGLRITPNVSQVYAFRGHEGDKFNAEVFGPAYDIEWRWKDTNPWEPTIEDYFLSKCEITPRYSNWEGTLQLYVDKRIVVCEKAVQILVLKDRSDWNAVAIKPEDFSGGMDELKALTIHHSSNSNDGPEEILRIQRRHINWNDWGDIGYHFVMTKDGILWEGRTLERDLDGKPYVKGAHTGGANEAAGLGICMLGNYQPGEFDSEPFPDARKRAFIKNAIAAMARYDINSEALRNHRHVQVSSGNNKPSLCPGKNVLDVYCDMVRTVRAQLEER